MGTTSEFRRAQARMAANVRHHPELAEDERRLMHAASRERKLREMFGPPPDGSTWLEHLDQIAGEAPPLTEQQRITLALLLGSSGKSAAAPDAGR